MESVWLLVGVDEASFQRRLGALQSSLTVVNGVEEAREPNAHLDRKRQG